MMPNAVGQEQLSQSVVQEHQRDRVLIAATAVFAKRSYTATTVDHLVAASKISFSTFYELFRGKEDCFLAAYERTVASAQERIVAGVSADDPPAKRVLTVLSGLVEALVADPLGARLVLVESQVAGPAPVARHEILLNSIPPELKVLRETSAIASELPEAFETATVGGVDWLLKQRISQGDIDDRETLLGQLAEIVLEPYLGGSETEALLER